MADSDPSLAELSEIRNNLSERGYVFSLTGPDADRVLDEAIRYREALTDIGWNIPMEHAPMHALDGGHGPDVVTLDNVREEANGLINALMDRARELVPEPPAMTQTAGQGSGAEAPISTGETA